MAFGRVGGDTKFSEAQHGMAGISLSKTVLEFGLCLLAIILSFGMIRGYHYYNNHVSV